MTISTPCASLNSPLDTKQPVELSDEVIIDIVAIFNNPESPKIKCLECEGTGHFDMGDDGYPILCDECEGRGYWHKAVNQAERVKQVRSALANSVHADKIAPKRESSVRRFEEPDEKMVNALIDFWHAKDFGKPLDEAAKEFLVKIGKLKYASIHMALRRLVLLKDHKDKNGKDEYYEEEQPYAWKQAKDALTQLESEGA